MSTVTVRFASGRSITRTFATRADADAYVALLDTWSYVARITVN